MSLYNTLFNSNRKRQKLYGSVSYMKDRDLRKLFHRKPNGISLDGKKHLKPDFTKLGTLVIAQPGSGKSTIIKNSILQKSEKFPHSFWVIDPAGDIYRDTHKWIEKQQYITKIINLDDASKSLQINVLKVAARTSNGLEDLASLLIQVQYEKATGGDPFWRDSAENLLLLLMRAVVIKKEVKIGEKALVVPENLEGVYMLLNWFGTNKQPVLDKFIFTKFDKKEKLKDDYNSLTTETNKNSENKTLQSIVSTAKSALGKIVNNDTLCKIISEDNFELEGLRYFPQAIYIQVREDRLSQSGVKTMLSILNTFLFAQCMELPSEREELLPVHAYIDEAGEFLIKGLPSYIVVMRKRSVSIMLFLQDLHQLDKYGVSEKKVIANNCLNKIIFGSVSYETASWASTLVGNDTKEVFDRPVGVPLISAQEIRDLPNNSFLYIHKNKSTILKMKPWYKQRRLKKRVQM